MYIWRNTVAIEGVKSTMRIRKTRRASKEQVTWPCARPCVHVCAERENIMWKNDVKASCENINLKTWCENMMWKHDVEAWYENRMWKHQIEDMMWKHHVKTWMWNDDMKTWCENINAESWCENMMQKHDVQHLPFADGCYSEGKNMLWKYECENMMRKHDVQHLPFAEGCYSQGENMMWKRGKPSSEKWRVSSIERKVACICHENDLPTTSYNDIGHFNDRYKKLCAQLKERYGVASISRLLNSEVSFAREPYEREYILQKETWNFKEPTDRSQPISLIGISATRPASTVALHSSVCACDVSPRKIIGLFCKRDLQKRRYSAKETYKFKEPTKWLCTRLCVHMMSCCSVLQCVAVCCSVLQCVAVCCSVLQVITWYSHL